MLLLPQFLQDSWTEETTVEQEDATIEQEASVVKELETEVEAVVELVVLEAEVVGAVEAAEVGSSVEAGWANGTDAESLRAGIACLFTGYNPHALNPDLMCSTLKEASHNFFIKPATNIAIKIQALTY